MMLRSVRKGTGFEYVRTGKDIVVVGYDKDGNIGVLVDRAEIVSMSDKKFNELIENLEYAIEKIKDFRRVTT